jgi:hypothetical protein
LDESLNNKQISEVLVLINDSSNYLWGEIGTFEPGKTIQFYNAKNQVIGQIDIDVDGSQSCSYPHFKKRNRGYLRNVGLQN